MFILPSGTSPKMVCFVMLTVLLVEKFGLLFCPISPWSSLLSSPTSAQHQNPLDSSKYQGHMLQYLILFGPELGCKMAAPCGVELLKT